MANKKKKSKVSTAEALEFLDSLRKLHDERDEPTQAISLRVPDNILRAVKVKAKFEGKKYQSLIVEFIRRGLKS